MHMSSMFSGASTFNQDISSWDVGNVTHMNSMFKDAIAFDQDISGWDVDNVTHMNSMFSGASAFDQDINDWDVHNVTHFNSMFSGATAFNSYLDSWNVSSATTMEKMFEGATAFDKSIRTRNVITNGENYYAWDVSAITNMNSMFQGAISFAQNIRMWDVSGTVPCSVIDMFSSASSMITDYSGTEGFATDGTVTPSLFFNYAGSTTLLYYWDFRNSLSDTIIDKIGNKTATIRYVNGRSTATHERKPDGIHLYNPEPSLDINDTGVYIDLNGINTVTNISGEMTFEIVIKITNPARGNGCSHMFNICNQDGSDINNQLLARVNGGEHISVIRNDDSESLNVQLQTSNNPINENTFQHYIVTISDNKMKLYLNGGLIGSYDNTPSTVSLGLLGSARTNNYIGANETKGEGGYLNGTIKSFKIHSGIMNLSEADIAWDYGNALLDFDNICFLGTTEVRTDQGYIQFQHLNTSNTISNIKIKKIVKTLNTDDHMILIKKNALRNGIPNKDTYISKNHGIIINGALIRARDLVNGTTIQSHMRKKDLIYNILLEDYIVIFVNNMPCESLNAKDPHVYKYL